MYSVVDQKERTIILGKHTHEGLIKMNAMKQTCVTRPIIFTIIVICVVSNFLVLNYWCSNDSPGCSISFGLYRYNNIQTKRDYSNPYNSEFLTQYHLLLRNVKKYEKSTPTEMYVYDNTKSLARSREAIEQYHQKTMQYRRQFNCAAIVNGSESEIKRVESYHHDHRPKDGYPIADSEMATTMFYDCQAFRKIRGYVMDPGTPEEEAFPIAYVILAHLDFEHVERLMRLIYRPQHVFCIHMDEKVSDSLKRAVAGLASCFPNIILPSHPQNVIYAHMSRLEADLTCMRGLLDSKVQWKYMINMAATSLPLQPNRKTMDILKLLKGKSDIREVFGSRAPIRWQFEYLPIDGVMKRSTKAYVPAPHNLTITKGMAYNTFSREFLVWAMKDTRARDLLQWSRKTYSPDEHYWATLNNLYHNPTLQTPGGFKDHPDRKGYFTMVTAWAHNSHVYQCRGHIVHNICLYGAGDLTYVSHKIGLTANKFDLTHHPVGYGCIEEWFENRTRTAAHTPTTSSELDPYASIYFVRYDRKV